MFLEKNNWEKWVKMKRSETLVNGEHKIIAETLLSSHQKGGVLVFVCFYIL